ncbi:MAG: GTPase ObgE [Deltaproteobacteria bacterium]|nr:GTPase ObgE [Deltaproteobacteria bacterium]
MRFIDEAQITVKAGDGGSGCVSFRREKYVPKGGPDGGNAGAGGAVIFIADVRLSSLLDFRYRRIYEAERGEHGMGSLCSGRDGEDLKIRVPAGTLIKDLDSGEALADLVSDGQTYVCCKGGRGGKGNAHFKTATHHTPRFAQPGEPGEFKTLKLELKLLADVGIIGFPNAGKSTLISRISAAKPKIADYPFTTLVPNLGVVKYGEFGGFVVADIPGLIEGAHEGKGLGSKFLKHIERTGIFIHVIDLSPMTERDPKNDFKAVNKELKSFNPELSKRPQVVALNKVDITESRHTAGSLLKFFFRLGIKVLPISAVTGEGIPELIDYVGAEVERLKGARLGAGGDKRQEKRDARGGADDDERPAKKNNKKGKTSRSKGR